MNNKNTYFIEGTMFIQEEKVILLSSTGSVVPWSAVPLIPGNCVFLFNQKILHAWSVLL
jgi:hypothetical protein